MVTMRPGCGQQRRQRSGLSSARHPDHRHRALDGRRVQRGARQYKKDGTPLLGIEPQSDNSDYALGSTKQQRTRGERA
jgi:hypothetical protein